MIEGQLALEADRDHDWVDASDVSSHAYTKDPWSDCPQTTFSTFTPPALDSVTGELPSLLERWFDSTFVPDVTTRQTWATKWVQSGETSPFRTFLNQPGVSSSFDTLLTYVRYGLRRENGKQLAERLSELRLDLAYDEESPDLSMSSFLGFVEFLRLNPKLRDPSIVVGSTGAVRAEWHESWTQHFVVEFTSSTNAQFVIFVADQMVAGKKIHISITCSIASLLQQALPHGVATWAMRGESEAFGAG